MSQECWFFWTDYCGVYNLFRVGVLQKIDTGPTKSIQLGVDTFFRGRQVVFCNAKSYAGHPGYLGNAEKESVGETRQTLPGQRLRN